MASIQRLLKIMARLRDPVDGCPWDLKQDFSSISPFTIEEAYEVDEAILSGDLEALRDELGDLLFQVVFQARIAEELGAFDFDGVVDAISSKMVRRHPHIFAGAGTPETAQDQTATWESIKAEERSDAAKRKSGVGEATSPNPFAGIPRNLSALARSAKIAGRLEQLSREESAPSRMPAGPTPSDPMAAALSEMRRTISQAEAAISTGTNDPDRASRLSLVGQGLRSWVLFSRELGIDPEQALREADDAEIAAAEST
jgi:NTP pyrophosphatase (non-canonical NTP hydrolase)